MEYGKYFTVKGREPQQNIGFDRTIWKCTDKKMLLNGYVAEKPILIIIIIGKVVMLCFGLQV